MSTACQAQNNKKVKIKIKRNIKCIRRNVWSKQTKKKKKKKQQQQKLKRRSAKWIATGNVVATMAVLMTAVTQARAS